MDKLISIVVLAWNNKQDLEKCINSILDNTKIKYKLIIVDNNSQDNTKEYLLDLEETWDNENLLKVIFNPENSGYAKGNNLAIPYLEGDYVLFLNQDIVVTNKSIDKMALFLEENNEYKVIAPQLRYPDGRIQLSCRKLPTPKSMIQNYLKMSWDDSKDFDHTKSQVCEQPMASAIMLKTKVFEEINGFDDHQDYWLFFNDVDLSKKIKQKGYKTYFLADIFMYHHHGSSTKKLFNLKKQIYWHKGMIRYFRKWYCYNLVTIFILYFLSAISFTGLILRDLVK